MGAGESTMIGWDVTSRVTEVWTNARGTAPILCHSLAANHARTVLMWILIQDRATHILAVSTSVIVKKS